MRQIVIAFCFVISVGACGSDGPGVDDVVPPSSTVPAGPENQVGTDVTVPVSLSRTTDSKEP